jgi:hypothetical protein
MFVNDDIDPEVIVNHTAYLARAVQDRCHLTSETDAQLERIANSGKADQPSEPTTPTTTAPAPVEYEEGRTARRAGEHLRASGNGGQGAEASHA